MGHDSVSEMLRNIGDNDTADAINVHEQCHQEIAELCGKISHLEAQLAHNDKVIEVLAEDVAALKNQYEFEDTTPEYESELAEAKAKEG